MSGSFPGSQSQVSLLGPGIVGLFVQGIESGLVFAQFSQWFFESDRSQSPLLSTIVVFVTVVGQYVSSRLLPCDLIINFRLSSAQSGASFASAWSKYVWHYGTFVRSALLALAASVTRV